MRTGKVLAISHSIPPEKTKRGLGWLKSARSSTVGVNWPASRLEAAKEKKVFVTGRGFDQTKIAPDLVLTNILEDWGAMFGSTADQVKAGKLFGTFVQYGYDTAPVTGGSLAYEEGKPFNPVVPDAVVKEVEDMAKQFASGALKVVPTDNDARSGS